MIAGNATRTTRYALAAVLAAVLLAACSREPPADEPAPPAPVPDTQTIAPDPEPEPATDADADAGAVDPDALADSPAGTAGVTGFHGFGPARFGDDEESVRIAWGRPLAFDREPEPGDSCAWLRPDPQPSDAFRIGFLFEHGQFVRYDVVGAGYEAPGGGRVGNTLGALESLYRDRFELTPAADIAGGQTLRVAGPDGAPALLVFDLDADGLVRGWRIGLSPPVDQGADCR